MFMKCIILHFVCCTFLPDEVKPKQNENTYVHTSSSLVICWYAFEIMKSVYFGYTYKLKTYIDIFNITIYFSWKYRLSAAVEGLISIQWGATTTDTLPRELIWELGHWLDDRDVSKQLWWPHITSFKVWLKRLYDCVWFELCLHDVQIPKIYYKKVSRYFQ